MFFKFLIGCTLLCLAVADVKDLSRMYLPPASESVSVISAETKSEVAAVKDLNRMYLPPALEESSEKSADVSVVPDLSKNDIVANDEQFEKLETLTKDVPSDPAYPYGYNGLPGGFPGAFPQQGFPGQGFPGQGAGFPGQGFPPGVGLGGQGFPGEGFGPSQGLINPGIGIGGQGFPGQGFPGQGFPGQGFPGAGFPGQGFPGAGFPGAGFPGAGFPGAGFPGAGFPGQGFPGQGFPYQRYPLLQGLVPGFTGAGYTNGVYSAENSKPEQKSDVEDENTRQLSDSVDTQYDSTNGGYLYKKPSVGL